MPLGFTKDCCWVQDIARGRGLEMHQHQYSVNVRLSFPAVGMSSYLFLSCRMWVEVTAL